MGAIYCGEAFVVEFTEKMICVATDMDMDMDLNPKNDCSVTSK